MAGGFLPPLIVELKATITEFEAKMGEAKKEMDDVAKKGASSFDQLATFGKGALLGLGAAAVSVGGVALEMSDKFEKAHATLTAALANSGTSFEANSAVIAKNESAFTKLGFSNDQYEAALARMVGETHNASASMNEMGLVADLARARHMDLADAAQLVGRAMDGDVSLLKRYGIEVAATGDKTVDAQNALKAMNAEFGGTAAAQAETFAGQMQALHATLTNVASDIGMALIPKIEALAHGVEDVVDWFKKHQDAAVALAAVIGGALTTAISAYIIKEAMAFTKTVVDQVTKLASALMDFLVPSLDATTTAEIGAAEAESFLTAGLSVAAGIAGAAAIAFVAHSNALGDSTTAMKAAADATNANAAALITNTDATNADAAATNADAAATNADAAAKKDLADSSQSLIEKLVSDKDALDAVNTAHDGVANAAVAHKKAQDDLNKLLARGPVDAKAVATATDAVTTANDKLTTADNTLSAAQAKLNDLLKPQNPDDVAAASDKLWAAQDKVKQSSMDLADAQKALNDLLNPQGSDAYTKALERVHRAQSAMLAANASGNQAEIANATKELTDATNQLSDAQQPATAEDLAKAHLRVDDAQRAVHDSTRAVTTATADLAATERPTIGTAEQIAAARNNVATATDGVTNSTNALKKAHADLAAAQAGDPTFADQIAAARQRVADTTDAITKAQDTLVTDTQKAEAAQADINSLLKDNPGLVDAAWAELKKMANDPALANSPLMQWLEGKVGAQSGVVAAASAAAAAIAAVAAPDTGNILSLAAPTGPGLDLGSLPLGGIAARIGSITTALAAAGGGIPSGLQHGGPVGGGDIHLVGEAGPELFVPATSGTVIPNHALGGLTVHVGAIVVNGATNPEETAVAVRTELLRLGRRNINVGLN